jgi:DNA-binding NtrC family response regulator
MERETMRALLVEPDPTAAGLLEGLLADAPLFDYRVTRAASLAEALALLRRGPWGVVLLDLALPGGQGAALAQAVQGLAPDTPVVALTGRDDEDPAVAALRERAQDCLARDRLDRPGLLRALRRAVERHRAGQHFRQVQEALAGVDRTVARLQELAAGPPERGSAAHGPGA